MVIACNYKFCGALFQKTPFTAMDIYLIEDAIKVIPVYLNAFQIILIVLAVAAGIAGLVWLWIKGPKQQEKYTISVQQ